MSNAETFGYVDAMRGIAILMVILVHTAQFVTGLGLSRISAGLATFGQMGVQLLLVAPPYTLCLSFRRKSGEPAVS